MNENTIHISKLKFGYNKSTLLLDDINMDFEKGRIHGLFGKNGEGKSTLLKLICGLLFPKEGNIQVFGFIPEKRQPAFLNSIYFLPEELPHYSITIEEYEKIYSPFYPDYKAEQFNTYLNEFGIDSKKEYLDKLSLGQKKKIFISFGLATNTQLIVMDEPTNGLDIPSKGQFRKIVASTIDENKCIIISTHQVKDLESLIDNIIIMDNHEILLNEPIENITEKLLFTLSTNDASDESVLYSTDTLKGTYQVKENIHGEDSKLDIELLFYTALSNRAKLTEIFNKK